MNRIINPFEKIAGWKALFIGLLVLIVQAGLASKASVHYDGILDMHISEVSFIASLLELLTNLLCLVLFMYLAGVLASKSKIRFIDVAGTMAFARIPYALAALATMMLPVKQLVSNLREYYIEKNPDLIPTPHEWMILLLYGLIILFFLIWMITWIYQAFKVACNAKGSFATFTFILGLLFAEISSKLLIVKVILNLEL